MFIQKALIPTLFALSSLYTTSRAQCIEAGPSAQCPIELVTSVICTDASPCCCNTAITCNGCGTIGLSGTSTAAGQTITGTGDDNLAITCDGTGSGQGATIGGTPGGTQIDGVTSFTVSGVNCFQNGNAYIFCGEDVNCPVDISSANGAQGSNMQIANPLSFSATGANAIQGANIIIEWDGINPDSGFQLLCGTEAGTDTNNCAGATIEIRDEDCGGSDDIAIAGIQCIGNGACEGTTINFNIDPACDLTVGTLQCGDGTNDNDCDGLTITETNAGTVTFTNCNCNPVGACTGASGPSGSGATCLGATDAPTTGAPTAAPVTAAPTAAPVTAAPTAAPVTAAPTAAPVTAAPTTGAPTAAPITSAPTAAPVTAAPTTASPTTASPTTAAPTTSAPTTAAPTTAAPTTGAPTTAAPTEPEDVPVTTGAPTTAAPTEPEDVPDRDDDDDSPGSDSDSASSDDELAEMLEHMEAAKAETEMIGQDEGMEQGQENSDNSENYEMVLSLSTEALEHLWAIVILFVVFNAACVCVWYYRNNRSKKRYGFETEN